MDYDSFITGLFAKAALSGVPLSGGFELTSRCTLNCKMCYIHRQGNCRAQDEKGTEWWLKLASDAKEAGMLILLLTGGEPLLREDFYDIYSGCLGLGLMVSVNTNGTLIDSKAVEFFKKNPPQRLNITLYGMSPETYGELCGNSKAYEKVISAILALKQAGVNIKLNYSLTPQNQQDALKAYEFAKRIEVPIQLVSYMFPPVRSCGDTVRLSAEDAAKATYLWQKNHFGNRFSEYRRLILKGEAPQEFSGECLDKSGEKISCRAGSTTFWVTWQGELTPCGMMTEPKASLDAVGFKGAWEHIRAEREKIILPPQCTDCKYRKVCDICAAVSYAETGKFDGLPIYACEKAKSFMALFKE